MIKIIDVGEKAVTISKTKDFKFDRQMSDFYKSLENILLFLI
jgi:hypothetical protein